MKINERRIFRLFFSTILFVLFGAYLFAGILIAHDNDVLSSYEMKQWVITNIARLIPYLALFLFAQIAGKSSYINDRLYVFVLFVILTAQFFIMEGQNEGALFAPIYEFCDALDIVAFVTAVIMWSRIVVLCLLPISGKWVLKIYSAAMLIFYVCVFFHSASSGSMDFVYTPVLVAEAVFHAGLYNFSELMTEENESVVCKKVLAFITPPFIKAWWDELFGVTDEEFDMLRDLDNLAENDDYDMELSYNRMLVSALYHREKEVLIASELIRKFNQKQFVDENGEVFSDDYIYEQYNIIYKYLLKLHEEKPGSISERLLNAMSTMLESKETADFMVEAVFLASLMIGPCYVAWQTAVMDDYDEK